jgi:hypothetical protein
VSARREGDRLVVLVPARLTPEQEAHWVSVMVARVSAKERRRAWPDDELAARATELSRRYLQGRARPRSVRWVDNQQRSRWGSCTPSTGTIRLSSRLQDMPPWVVDYVLLHELAHLLVSSHGARFWAQLAGYPQLDRARGFLAGYSAGYAARRDTSEGGRGPARDDGMPDSVDDGADGLEDEVPDSVDAGVADGTDAGAWDGDLESAVS